MKAAEFFELCKTDWDKANQDLAGLLGKVLDEKRWLSACIDVPDGIRADADLAREVEDKLFEALEDNALSLNLRRYNTGLFGLQLYKCLGHKERELSYTEHVNLSWLRAAALVELMTEGK